MGHTNTHGIATKARLATMMVAGVLACAPLQLAIARPSVDIVAKSDVAGLGIPNEDESGHALPTTGDELVGPIAMALAVAGAGTFSLGAKIRRVSLHRN